MIRRGFSTIKQMIAREILDSRGNPTVEVDLATENGIFRASVPSGLSRGIYEAFELRDRDFSRYSGKGVTKACYNINSIILPAIQGKSVKDQAEIDKFLVEVLDGTKNEWGYSKSKLGANSILAVSFAVARAGAASYNLPLFAYISKLSEKNQSKYVMPVPALNIINGGSHAENDLAMQEFMILPTGASSFAEGLRIGNEIYYELKSVIKKKYGQDATNVGDEGGFAPNIQENVEGLTLLMEAIYQAGYEDKVKLGMDVAASEFFLSDDKSYDLDYKNPETDGRYRIKGRDLRSLYRKYSDVYPIASIEDPFDQDDWENYRRLMEEIGEFVQIVGDDLLATNPARVKKAIVEKACNSLLISANQIGSLTESIKACKLAQDAGWGVMVSHRSGETDDNFIADLAVGLGAGQIKSGAPCRSECLAKYNQLLRIEEMLGKNSVYAGENFRNPKH